MGMSCFKGSPDEMPLGPMEWVELAALAGS